MAAQYSPKAQKEIDKTMKEYKKGELKSGRSGKPVKTRKQAVAIGISKARDKNYKVPPEKV